MDWTQGLKVAIPVLMFGATVLKEFLSKHTRLKAPYWALMTVCVAAGITVQLRESAEAGAREQVRQARELAGRGRALLEDALAGRTANLALSMEAAFGELQRAASLAAQLPERSEAVMVRLQALDDIAIGNERLAYGETRSACRYLLDDGGRLAACRVQQGAQIYKEIPVHLSQGVVHCTDVQDGPRWREAAAAYAALEQVLAAAPRDDRDGSAREVAIASRNLGYFRLCALLRQGSGEAAAVERAWRVTEAVTQASNRYRHDEIRQKLALLAALPAPAAALQCPAECARAP